MKVAILGGGISGLAAAHYLKRFAVPVSQVAVFEASARFGGWIDSKRVEHSGRRFVFEKGPRTLRASTGELKELNSLQMVSNCFDRVLWSLVLIGLSLSSPRRPWSST